MQRYRLGLFDAEDGRATPELSVFEAARLLDENARHPLLIRHRGLPVGVLTEDDIVAKVLAQGRDPRHVRVGEIMERGRVSADGTSLSVDDENVTSPLHASLAMGGEEEAVDDVAGVAYAGLCEECGVDRQEVYEIEGLVLCEECLPLHSTTRPA